ncbi:MAG: bifunctional oligoribonuclease/PAP phosphatase NrnA [Bacteroidota bacterium]|nr:bifunctional oligoribonuclease/PAP phosphatase NrnA [Bacteroidota bacterium]
MKEQFSQLKHIFETKQSFVITTHVNPDADAIGSEVALASFLHNKGKQVKIVNQSETPDHLIFLTKIFPVETYSSHLDHHILKADCFIVIDTNSPKRFSAFADIVQKSKAYKVCIDHHLEHDQFADLYIIDTEVPAASELLYRILVYVDNTSITKPIADALYAGIMTDTGSFKFPKTDSETHTITADLLARGVNPYEIYQEIFENGAINKLHLLGKALESIEMHDNGKISAMVLPRSVFSETNSSEADVDNFTNYVLSIKGVIVGLVFVELSDGVKVSFRSKGDISVNTLAKQFNGGGHKNAAGARIKGLLLREAVNLVIEKTKLMLR